MRVFGSLQKKYFFVLGLFISGMILFAVFGSRGLIQTYQMKAERDRFLSNNARLQEENRRLAEQIQRLKNSNEEVEKIAREELGLVKKGEIVYQFER